MCGRFTTTVSLEEIIRLFQIEVFEGSYQVLYNAAPGQEIPVLVSDNPRKLAFFRWGLVPSWAKDSSIGNKLINARKETLSEKPSFRSAYQNRRCLIIADSFYEWKKEGQKTQPYRFVMKDKAPFVMAGLWEVWTPPHGEAIYSSTIITTTANNLVKEIHERMPAILQPKNIKIWLNQDIHQPALLEPLLKPYPSDLMMYYPVSLLVNSPKNNTAEVIKEAKP